MKIKNQSKPIFHKRFLALAVLALMTCIQGIYNEHPTYRAEAATKAVRTFADFEATLPVHTLASTQTTSTPRGLTPANIKTAYHLPATGGKGTIAIISAYKHAALEADLAGFDKKFSIASCTIANKCLEIHTIGSSTKNDSGWALESALDTEWAHAIAPNAKILVVEAASTKGADLVKAIDYARNRSDVVSVSMSWGGAEFSDELTLDKHFITKAPSTDIRTLNGSSSTATSTQAKPRSIAFFAASGDDGSGASWPAVSPYVVAVGGTSLIMASSGAFISEKAWSGSGGGVSAYETEPSFQVSYSIPRSNDKRAIPDVAYAADPSHGFSVYHNNGWYVVGGTSAGAPQWAAINALTQSVSLADLYKDKSSSVYATYFRDIVSGKNGTCTYYCSARTRYDYVTGLGSPITDKF